VEADQIVDEFIKITEKGDEEGFLPFYSNFVSGRGNQLLPGKARKMSILLEVDEEDEDSSSTKKNEGKFVNSLSLGEDHIDIEPST